MVPTNVVYPALHHVNLKTNRLQEMIDWYGVVVGMTVTHQFEGGAWYPSMNDLLDTDVRLAEHRILPHGCLDHGMTMSFYYVDPDGNSVELQCDEFGGDWAVGKAWMNTSPEFAANPIGVPIDPARVVAARDQGASEEELHRRAYAGEFTSEAPLDLRLPQTVTR